MSAVGEIWTTRPPIEVQTKVLPGGRVEVDCPTLPDGQKVTVMVYPLWEGQLDTTPHPDFAAAETLYYRDEPELLRTMRGKWVVYSPKGRIVEGDEPRELYRKCREMGLDTTHLVVYQVLPRPEVVDEPFRWEFVED